MLAQPLVYCKARSALRFGKVQSAAIWLSRPPRGLLSSSSVHEGGWWLETTDAIIKKKKDFLYNEAMSTPMPSIELFIKAGEDGKEVGDCPFAHYCRL